MRDLELYRMAGVTARLPYRRRRRRRLSVRSLRRYLPRFYTGDLF